jgi:hypothetical protein
MVSPCSASKCKEKKLGPSNKFICNLCNNTYCPDHRYYETHNCQVFLSQKNTTQLFSGEMEKYLIQHNMNKNFNDITKQIT